MIKMNPKTYLKQVINIDKIIRLNKERLYNLYESSKSISGVSYDSDRVQTSKTPGANFENKIAAITELEELIRSEIDESVRIEIDVRKTIDKLDDNNERLVLIYRYLDGLRFDEIAQKLDKAVITVNKYHRSALDKVDNIINK